MEALRNPATVGAKISIPIPEESQGKEEMQNDVGTTRAFMRF